MYGDNLSSTDNEQRGFLGFRQRRAERNEAVERNRAAVAEQYQRYEAIKSKYDWSGKKYTFIMRGDYCIIGEDGWKYDENDVENAVKTFVDQCEEKAKRRQEKRLEREERRTQHASFYGDLERRILELGGKFKYHDAGVSITLPKPKKIGKVKKFFLEYNDYDRVFLEEKVIILEKAHRERQIFISENLAALVSSHT